MRRYQVSIEVVVTDEEMLAAEARRIALHEGGISVEMFDSQRAVEADPIAHDVGWIFDHGSPFEAGIQIEQSGVTDV